MNEELDAAFKDYIEKFKELDIKDKRVEVVNSLKEISGLIDVIAESENKQLYYLKSKEISELDNGLESEDDFLEALLVYSENAKNLLAQYLIDKV